MSIRASSLQPFTVLMMLPSCLRGKMSSVSEEVARIWVDAVSPDQALEAAHSKIPTIFPDQEDVDDFAPVAIFAGRIADLHRN